MTDAERIAGYLNRFSLHGWTASDVEQEARYNKGQKPGLLMAMLSDVRREEREAEQARCLDILMRVGISAMEAGHTNVGKYIAAASTQIRGGQ